MSVFLALAGLVGIAVSFSVIGAWCARTPRVRCGPRHVKPRED